MAPLTKFRHGTQIVVLYSISRWLFALVKSVGHSMVACLDLRPADQDIAQRGSTPIFIPVVGPSGIAWPRSTRKP